jgi:adenylate cyclase
VPFVGEVSEDSEPAAEVVVVPTAAEPPIAPRLSIIVLPIANLSDDPEQQYFADGVTGDLMTDLSRIRDMLVISRNTAFTYRDKPDLSGQAGRREADRPRAWRALCARRRGPALGKSGPRHCPADRCRNRRAFFVRRRCRRLFDLQDEITNRIAVALDLELVDAAAARAIERPDTRDYICAEAITLFEPG